MTIVKFASKLSTRRSPLQIIWGSLSTQVGTFYFHFFFCDERIFMTTSRSGADENTDDDCVTDLLKKFAKNSTESVLIVWVNT